MGSRGTNRTPFTPPLEDTVRVRSNSDSTISEPDRLTQVSPSTRYDPQSCYSHPLYRAPNTLTPAFAQSPPIEDLSGMGLEVTTDAFDDMPNGKESGDSPGKGSPKRS